MVAKISMKVLLRAVVAAAVVAGAGAWLATRPGHQAAAPRVSASGANVANVTTEKAPTKRGKGQPQPAPSPTAGTRRHTNVEPAPSVEAPPCICQTPTTNLSILVSELRVRVSGVNVTVSAPPNDQVTKPTDISVLFNGSQRITQTFDPDRGNTISFAYPVSNGLPYRTQVDISLLERGDPPATFAYSPTVTINMPLDTEEAPPCNCAGPTPGLTILANAVRVRAASTSVVVFAPPHLQVTDPTQISVLFNNSKRFTVNYDPAKGNSINFDYPVGDGKPYRTRVDISFLDKANTQVPAKYLPTVTIVPHFIVHMSPLKVTLAFDCDDLGTESEPVFMYNDDRGFVERKYDMFGGDSRVINEFARDLTNITASGGYLLPDLFFTENDDPIGFRGTGPASSSDTPLVPGDTRDVNVSLFNGKQDCRGDFHYSLIINAVTHNVL